MDDKLQKDIDEQRVYLAGCEKMIPPASRHCFYCNQDVYHSFLPDCDRAEPGYTACKSSSVHFHEMTEPDRPYFPPWSMCF